MCAHRALAGLVVLAGILPAAALAQPQVQMANQTVQEGSAGPAQVELAIRLSAPAGQLVTVNYATIAGNPPATAGTACAGAVDFESTAGTVRFEAGDIDQTIPVTICGDVSDEVDELFRVRLTNAAGATIADGTIRVTIADDDAPAPVREVSVDDLSVLEGSAGAGLVALTVRLSAASDQPVTVTVAGVGSGSATRGTSCLSGADAVFLQRTVTIPANQGSATTPFTVCGDQTVEPDESFTVELRNPAGATIGDATAVVTIRNDDFGPLTVSVGDTTVTEGGSGSRAVNVRVTLSRESTETVTVNYTFSAAGTATPGTCGSGGDFSASAGTLSFLPGDVEEAIPVDVCGDLAIESNETVLLSLNRPTVAALGDRNAVLTIQDDEIARAVVPRDEDIRVRVEPALPNLEVDVVATREQTAPDLFQEITVRNTGNRTAAGVVVRATLPPGVAFGGFVGGGLGTCGTLAGSGGRTLVNCAVGALAAGASRSGQIRGTIESGVSDGLRLEFLSQVDPAAAVAETDETDNEDTASVTVRVVSDLRVVSGTFEKIGANGDGSFCAAFCSHTAVILFLRVKNEGPGRSSATTIAIDWPGGISQIPEIGAQEGCPPGSGFDIETDSCVTGRVNTPPCFEVCGLGSIGPRETHEIGLMGLMQPPRGRGTVPVRVTVDPGGRTLDAVLSNNTRTFQLPVP